jgi:hypothetical protein
VNAQYKPDRVVFQSQVRPYLDAGLVLVPLRKWDAPDGRGKTPRDDNWTKIQYDGAEVLADALKRGTNVGVRPGSRFVIVDVDPRNGGDKSFRTFCKAHDLDPLTLPLVNTGGGGFHFFARLPKGSPKLRKKLKDFPGIEFLSGNGVQAVCAGSRHPSGNHYEWDWLDERPALKAAPVLAANIVDALAKPSVEDMESDAPDVETVAPEVIVKVLSHMNVADFRDQEEWQNLMFATVAASSGDAMDEFISWSTSDPLYADHAERIATRWQSVAAERPGGITGRTFYWIARKHGVPAGVLAKLMPRTTAAEDFGDDADFLAGDDEAVQDDDNEFEADSTGTAAAVTGIRVNNNSVAYESFDNAMAAVLECGFVPQFNELSHKVEFREGRNRRASRGVVS